jgi:hypothetical protein
MLMKKLLVFAGFILFLSPVKSQSYLSEGFETGARPEGWTEEFVQPPVHTEPWRYRNGGHSPNDNNWLVPPGNTDITRNPPAAYAGTYNAIFFKQGDNNERTKLITPPLNLAGGTKVELSFYLCQIPWTFEGSTGWDVLRVYYKVSSGSPWVLLHEYLDPVYDWELQTLDLPNLSSTYYIAFEGHTRWGYGTCIDNIAVEEKGFQQLWIGDLQFNQPFTSIVPSGATDVPLMRVDFKVFGNTGTATLDHINFTSLNTSDSDVKANTVRLYSTINQTFSKDNQLGASTNFSSGIASFSGLNHNLVPGQSYLWLVVDIEPGATHGNILDVMVAANGIMANDTLYPEIDESPVGQRIIYETLYFENFEGVHNWDLTGEFEVATPDGMGGSPGNPNPTVAHSGLKVLGTDLTGLGANPYNYEPSLTESTAYKATSPAVDVFYYKNLYLFFERHFNIEVWDMASIQVSRDNGSTWTAIWESSGYINDFQWTQIQQAIPDNFSRTSNLKLRFQLGPTDGQNNYSGWNIDDIFLTGEFISRDVGVSEWIYPLSGCGHSASDSVTVRIENFGGADITEPIPVAYSFDGGSTWTIDNCSQNIPIGGSVVFTFPTKADLSEPGFRSNVIAKTLFPGDQFTGNDQVNTQIFVIPTKTPEYIEDFEDNEGYWYSMPGSIWAHGMPSGAVINSSSSGSYSWVTGLTQKYGNLISQSGRVIFEDDFETLSGWTFTGEFERNIPIDLPYFAASGYYCIGTDLSGLGTLPYMYEKGINAASAYNATSPALDVSAYSNLKVAFARWLYINQGDSVRLQVSPNNGTTWYTLWKNTEGEIFEEDWDMVYYDIPDSLAYSTQLRLRFSLFYSSATGDPAYGLNVDDFVLTGDLVNTASFSLITPCFDLTDLTHPVFEAMIWVDTEEDVDGATLFYSTDGGTTWLQVSNTSGFDEYWNWYTGKPVSALGLNGWSGQSNGWIRARHLLPQELTAYGSVQFKVVFMADKFNNNFDGIAIDDVKIFQAPHDLGVIAILDPVSDCELPTNQTFTLRLRNFGIRNMAIGDTITVGFHIEREGELQTAQETIHLSSPFASGTTRDISFSTEFNFGVSGEYHVEVYTIEEEPLFYNPVSNNSFSDIILAAKPVFTLGPDVYTVRPDTLVLNAYAGIGGLDYLWQDNSTDSVYYVSSEGTYSVKVTNQLGCFAVDEINIYRLIADVGVKEILSPVSSCELGNNIPLVILIENFGTDTLNVEDSIFIFGELNQSINFKDTLFVTDIFYPGTTREFTFTQNFDFSPPGTYHLKLYTELTDDYSNINDTLDTNLYVHGYPVVDLGPDRSVNDYELLLDPGAGFSEYLWQDGSQEQEFLVTIPGEGLYHVMVTDINNCSSSDTVSITLNVLDISVDRILSPETSCGLSNTITVSARIINSGSLVINSGETIEIAYKVDEGTPVVKGILLDSDLNPGNTIDYVFPETVTVETGNWYDFTVFVSFPGDMKLNNDTVLMPVGVFATPVVDLGPSFQVVTALEYVLDAGPGFASYLWHDGSTNQTFTVTQQGINTYSVTVTDSNGCTAFDQIQILLVIPDVGVLEIEYPQTSCMLGDQENIKVAIKNYGNSNISTSADIKVAFSVNGSSAVIENVILASTFGAGDTIHHTFLASSNFSIPGDYEITAYTIFSSDLVPGNNSKTSDIQILGVPLVDIGSGLDTLLVYEQTMLSATPGYASYLWQDGSTGTTFTIDQPGAGLYHVLVTDNNGCYTRDTVFVAYDIPDLGISQIISPVSSCELGSSETISIEIVNNGYYRISSSESITLSYSVNNGPTVNESRSLGSTLQPSASMILNFNTKYDFSSINSYNLTVSIDFANDSDPSNDEKSSEIEVWGNPVVDIGDGKDTINTTLPIVLDAGEGFTSYSWQDNSTGRTYNVNQYGLYWVTVTNEFGCSTRDSLYVDSPVGISNPISDMGQIKIYPNPADDILNVQIQADVNLDFALELFTIHNQLIYHASFKNTSVVEEKIFVNKFTSGTYLLRITADKAVYTYKIIVR